MLRYLQAASKTVVGNNDLLVGYVIQARGMLGDRNVLEVAKIYLSAARDKNDTSGVLGRRAALLGVGLTGAQEAIPILIQAWDLSYYVEREAPLAMALCQAVNTAQPLLKLLKGSDQVMGRAFAARCLGELFTPSRPARIAWLINGGNYMFKNDKLRPYQALANEFLCNYLLQAFGDTWK